MPFPVVRRRQPGGKRSPRRPCGPWGSAGPPRRWCSAGRRSCAAPGRPGRSRQPPGREIDDGHVTRGLVGHIGEAPVGLGVTQCGAFPTVTVALSVRVATSTRPSSPGPWLRPETSGRRCEWRVMRGGAHGDPSDHALRGGVQHLHSVVAGHGEVEPLPSGLMSSARGVRSSARRATSTHRTRSSTTSAVAPCCCEPT